MNNFKVVWWGRGDVHYALFNDPDKPLLILIEKKDPTGKLFWEPLDRSLSPAEVAQLVFDAVTTAESGIRR